MRMETKTRITTPLLFVIILLFLGGGFVLLKQANKPSISNSTVNKQQDPKLADIASIGGFMGNPSLKVSFIKEDVPMPYFRVGRVTKTKDGEYMQPTDDWLRKVNVYRQEDLIEGSCSVYEYHIDVRNHKLVAVLIAGLNQNEIEALEEKGTPCLSAGPKNNVLTITKGEAQDIAFGYLRRTLPNFEEIKDKFAYSKDKSHSWIWENKDYRLPAGLEGRPYSYPTIRISVYDDGKIQYWNTVPLFED